MAWAIVAPCVLLTPEYRRRVGLLHRLHSRIGLVARHAVLASFTTVTSLETALKYSTVPLEVSIFIFIYNTGLLSRSHMELALQDSGVIYRYLGGRSRKLVSRWDPWNFLPSSKTGNENIPWHWQECRPSQSVKPQDLKLKPGPGDRADDSCRAWWV